MIFGMLSCETEASVSPVYRRKCSSITDKLKKLLNTSRVSGREGSADITAGDENQAGGRQGLQAA